MTIEHTKESGVLGEDRDADLSGAPRLAKVVLSYTSA